MLLNMIVIVSHSLCQKLQVKSLKLSIIIIITEKIFTILCTFSDLKGFIFTRQEYPCKKESTTELGPGSGFSPGTVHMFCSQ